MMPLILEMDNDRLMSALPVVVQLDSDSMLGIKKIDGTEVAMLDCFPHLRSVIDGIHNKMRILERLSVYQLLYAMLSDTNLVIQHNEDGKPILVDWQISVSDTRGYVSIILSRTKNVAVDIEYMSTRVEKIAKRFIRSDEQSDTVSHMLLNWSSKETVFKYYSSQHLGYFDMRLLPHQLSPKGRVVVENLKGKSQLKVDYCFTDDFVLTWACD